MPDQYIGEHLLPGLLGKTFVWISFISAILAAVVYFLNSRKEENPAGKMKTIARSMFLIHASTLTAVAIVLYYIIFRHYFEYSYVWEYSSKTLPVKYIISCFWAGQEGSFLVWALSQAIIGVVLLFIAKEWENRVMSVVSISQVFVTSMMLGIKVFGYKIGGSPFILLRESYSSIKDSIFQLPDYLSNITDGNGLNPLLENIWMTIHPPILFVGYALALVPFAYAIASLMKKEYHSWIKPAIPWTVLSLTMLGAGILLGGAWAYVSLTFGGFWSWDPVENSSLVPWMTLVAGLHFLIIARKQNYALLIAYIFITISYVLVLYASFLTRSGVLGDTSAHAFGDNGMTAQLLIYMLTFLVMMIILILINVRRLTEKKKEIFLSKEFWMFIGAIIIILSAFQILLMTSVPVFNRLFGTDFAPPSDRVGFYNRWQIPYALLVAGFIAFSQYLNYNVNNPREFFRKMMIPLGISVAFLVPFIFSGIVQELNYILMLFFVLFSIISSIYNLILRTSSPRNIGGIITHIGFAIFLLGTLLTFSNSRTISANTSSYDLGTAKANAESLLLMRGDTLYMSGFYVTYANKVTKGNLTEYQVDFLKRRNSNFYKEFTLFPSVNRHPRMGDVYNPDTRHFLLMDYYTYISFASKEPDYIVIKAIMNPYINILWLGAILMTFGLAYAFWRRIRRKTVNNT
jgi:cytochrome c-type biogenesis protein CcmF